MYPDPEWPMNKKELEELIAKAREAGVPCPDLEAKLARGEYNRPEQEAILMEIVLCNGDPNKINWSENQSQIRIIKCVRELSN